MDNISSTAWSNAKSVWKGTSKWFSNSYKSLKDWTGICIQEPTIVLMQFQVRHGLTLNQYLMVLENGYPKHMIGLEIL
ncbi:hypothetical protein HIL23_14345 [Staphylococcus aureus]|nr:hypothetical protein [Staphylococcus aureus]